VTAKSAPEANVATIAIGRWEQAGAKFTALAHEFPAEAYESTAVDGIRTFGGVLRHVAFWNRYVAEIVRGNAADDSANELPQADYSTKTSVLAALRESIDDSARALKQRPAPWDAKTIETVLSFLEHTAEHYGQLVVYARLRGIVPPASRP
jgi:hypothetical protein